MPTIPSRKGVPKGDKRARTRERLIEAAAHVIEEKGFERTSLEEVAARAGMTRGAIYGNFRDKDELFIAYLETRWSPVMPRFKPGGTFKEQMGLLGAAVVQSATSSRAKAAGMMSFYLYVVTHEEMRRQLLAKNAQIYAAMEQGMGAYFDPAQLPMAPGELVRVLHAMTEGFVVACFLQPEVFSEELVVKAFEALA